jgi:hypothetical protein
MRDTTEADWLEGPGNYDEVYADMKERAQGPPDQDHPRPEPDFEQTPDTGPEDEPWGPGDPVVEAMDWDGEDIPS